MIGHLIICPWNFIVPHTCVCENEEPKFLSQLLPFVITVFIAKRMINLINYSFMSNVFSSNRFPSKREKIDCNFSIFVTKYLLKIFSGNSRFSTQIDISVADGNWITSCQRQRSQSPYVTEDVTALLNAERCQCLMTKGLMTLSPP